ncbi:MAG: hypothetical protein ACQEXN_04450 [Actinomycetota bacterium]
MGPRTVPLLPCGNTDEITAFFALLGSKALYRQLRPNPYIAFSRDVLELHYVGMDGFRPEDSHGSCLVLVADT